MAQKKEEKAKKTTARAVAKPAKRAAAKVTKPAGAGEAASGRKAAAASGDVASGRASRPRRPTASAGPAAAPYERPLPSTSPEAASSASAATPAREARPLPTAPAGQVPVIALDGSVSGTLALPAELAETPRRSGVLFQSLAVAASNAHLGTAATKNRARVSGGGAKPWRQKGTGRARQGSTRAPHWRHGGVVFGPNGRRYERRIPEKMRREAFAEAFAARARAGRVLAFEGITFDETPRTRAVIEWLGKVGDTGSVLIVTPAIDAATARAAANAARVAVRSVGALRTTDVLMHDTVLVRRDALEALAQRASISNGRSA